MAAYKKRRKRALPPTPWKTIVLVGIAFGAMLIVLFQNGGPHHGHVHGETGEHRHAPH